MAQVERVEQTFETIGGLDFDAQMATSVIDEIINEIYLPFRGARGYGTERAVLVAPPHAEHRENDAEHSWSLALTAYILYDQREKLGLAFPEGFDINKAVILALVHDIPEIKSDDVNAMTPDLNLIALKSLREHAAMRYFREECVNFAGVMDQCEEYERKDTPEAQYVSDIDKIIACRIIFLDEGKKWHNWEGHQTSRALNEMRMRGKMITDMGHSMLDALIEDIDKNPHVFPYEESADDSYQQLLIPGVQVGEL